MPTDMPRCETCRHWERITKPLQLAESWGSCQAEHEMALVGGYTLMQGGDLDTHADFGCIAHEPKEG